MSLSPSFSATGLAGLLLVGVAMGAYLGSLGLRRPISLRIVEPLQIGGAVLAVVLLALGRSHWSIALAACALAVGAIVITRRELVLPKAGLMRVKVGALLPPFQLLSTAGALYSHDELIKKAPALIVLYRGFWCPYCVAQLRDVERHHDALRAAGVTIFAVSVDLPAEELPLENRLGGRVKFLSDPEGGLLDALNVRHRDGVPWYDRLLFKARRQDIARPTSLLVDEKGVIQYIHRAARIDERAPIADVIAAAGRS